MASEAGQRRQWRMRRPRLALASQILVVQLVIIVASAVVGVAVSVLVERHRLDIDYEQRALAIAEAVASTPTLRDAMLSPDPPQVIQPLAESVRVGAEADFVVVLNRDGIRYSHPMPALIGQRVDDNGPGLDGHTWVGLDNGSVGPAVRAKAPIFAADHSVIGVVSVGFRENVVSSSLLSELLPAAAILGAALALAVLGSVLLARHVKRRTFGMEPHEIAAMFEQREAILHGIREGTIATDLRGRLTVVNDEARDLLQLGGDCVGRRASDVLPQGRIREMLAGGSAETDEVLIAGERVLVANRMPVVARGGTIGYVVTLRDRTELMGVLRELDSVRSLSDALRAQAHEFSNRLHTIAGLIEMGRHEEAVRLITEESSLQQELLETLVQRIGDPVLSALLLGKSVVADERGIHLRLSDDTLLTRDIGDPRDLVTVVGNLIDNALDAVALQPSGARWVEVSARLDENDVVVRVRDSGPGVDPALGERIFDEGVSSKAAVAVSPRGLGLALVRQVVRRRGGSVEVANDGGAVFTARLPIGPRPGAEANSSPVPVESATP